MSCPQLGNFFCIRYDFINQVNCSVDVARVFAFDQNHTVVPAMNMAAGPLFDSTNSLPVPTDECRNLFRINLYVTNCFSPRQPDIPDLLAGLCHAAFGTICGIAAKYLLYSCNCMV